MSNAEPAPQSSTRFDLFAFMLGAVILTAALFVPMFVVSQYDVPTQQASHEVEVTVGIGVILRAAARQLIRGGARTFLRTTFSTFSRAAARTVTRRLIRFFMHSLLGALGRRLGKEAELTDYRPSPAVSRVAVLVGIVALFFSFWGVLRALPTETQQALLGSGAISVATLCGLAALPLLFYTAIAAWAGRVFHVSVSFATGIDGLLIQAYFTGAGSFLPMTTDVETEGTTANVGKVAACALAGCYLIHLALLLAASTTGWVALEMASGMFLIYAFVYSFPIAPLEGQSLWAWNKWAWLAVFVPILFSFIFAFPPSLSQAL